MSAQRAADLAELKKLLRALVVSSPVAVTAQALLRDYRNEMGYPLPAARFGYSCPVRFLRQQCADCFLFQGPELNPTLTLIVPKHLKHIDDFVQKQKVSSNLKNRVKRRSVQEPSVQKTFQNAKDAPRSDCSNRPSWTPNHGSAKQYWNQHNRASKHSNYVVPKCGQVRNDEMSKRTDTSERESPEQCQIQRGESEVSESCEGNEGRQSNGLKLVTRRLEALSAGSQSVSSSRTDSDGTGRSSSSRSSVLREALAALRREVRALVLSRPPVLCDDLPELYRQVHRRELDLQRFGYTGITAFALTLGLALEPAPHGGLQLLDHAPAAPGTADAPACSDAPAAPDAPSPLHCPPADPVASPPSRPRAALDDDALPGIDFEPDVFPADCMHYMEVIAPLGTAGAAAGQQLEVRVGEVYGPTHFWVQLLGPEHHIAMEEMMDDMAAYYGRGEGSERRLALGAAGEGHYCAALFERDWHRAVIVRRLDPDPGCDPDPGPRVKVRHVDYGTVDTVLVANLKPLLQRWAALPAQAVRARLAGIRPPAGARRWPAAASTAFLDLVRDKRFVASVVSVDREDRILSLLLVDTSEAQDVRVDEELVRSGYAEHTLEAGGMHEYPCFEALESGATPNYAEIHALLRNGIVLDCVPDFARYVPPLLPPRPAQPPATPSPATSSPATPPRAASSGHCSAASPPAASPAPAPAPAPSRPPPAASSVPVSPSPRPPPSPPAPAPSRPPPAASPRAELMNSVPVSPSPRPPPSPPAPAPAPAEAGWLTPLRPVAMPPPEELCRAGRRFRTERGEVTLSVAECEVYWLLLRVDPNAAHWYMVDAISRNCLPAPPPPAAPPFSRHPPSPHSLPPELRRPAPPPGPPPGIGFLQLPPQALFYPPQFAPNNYRFI